MFLLQQYSDALDALVKTCSATVPPPPPTCPALIAAAQVKVAQQNATVTTVWIQVCSNLLSSAKVARNKLYSMLVQVTLSKKMVDIAAGPEESAEAAVSVATTAAAARYAEIAKTITVSSSLTLVPF
jgi:hypothetical protein